ncbi:glycosyltransferase family 2 protein [Phaffia rhodozyma]|uniref:Chitin synthase n=1 Tax=Phaffia rhodozyma TaxID=264483 RepID=A0A0F7SQE4_PHARH|nr:glycosyltransferase family 2 protein [Phaffia rhodozyma]
MSRFPEADEGQYQYQNQPYPYPSDTRPPVAPYPSAQSPPPNQAYGYQVHQTPPPVHQGGYASPPPQAMYYNAPTPGPGYTSPPPPDPASSPYYGQPAYQQTPSFGQVYQQSTTPALSQQHQQQHQQTIYPPTFSEPNRVTSPAEPNRLASPTTGPQGDPLQNASSFGGPYSSINLTGTPQPMPSPGDYPPLVDSYQEDWHPSRASFEDDAERLLPSSGVGRSDSSNTIPGSFADLGDGENQEDNYHYGPVPSRVPRRNKTVKRVQLFRGHLVLDCPVPSKLLDQCKNTTEQEFKTMRYTAATCDPDNFKADGYALRQTLFAEPRKTELFIVLTQYNEGDELFLRTLRGVMQNIDYLCTKDKSKTWNHDGWKKVVVCVVSDGRAKIHPRNLACIQKLGCYQPGPAKNVVNGKLVTAHIYEYTTQFRVNSKLQIVPGNAESVPVQMLFVLKERNQKKLNSHRWFFNAFGPVLYPNVCVLIDVGTQPGPRSIYHLWKSFDLNSEVGGACGEIVALKGRYWSTLLKNPLVAAQNFEYKMSNILDKPLESIFGFISVLPGAFSAYRYIAVQNDPRTGEGPLQKYFLGETLHGAGAGIFDANMYLAEDRILCWELVSKRDSSWHLHYVKSAYGVTDVPDTIPDLVSQRRRWLNGSFFASLHATWHFYYIYRSKHTAIRKFMLHILIGYQAIQLIFSWFGIGNYFIAFYVLTKSMESFTAGLKWLNLILTYVYSGLTIACFLMALGNRPKGSKFGYSIAFVTFAIITVYMTFAAFYVAVKSISTIESVVGSVTIGSLLSDAAFTQIILSLLATFGIYILASLIHYDPWHMVTSLIQYLLISPSFISVMNVYAFCNTHDVSWGTKGQDKVSTDLGVVTSSKGGGNHAEVNVTIEAQDLNAEYQDAIVVLSSTPPKIVEVPNPEELQEDYYKAFRTRFVHLLLAWVLSNGFLVAIVLTATSTFTTKVTEAHAVEQSTSMYLVIVLYVVVVLALRLFVGE